jgi:tetratricopeptide (TPR) repeat protein
VKVFLSHSTKDKKFVELLAAALKSAGLEVWRCEVDIEKNENFVANIEAGLAQCDISLVIWSPDAAASVWTTEEWTSVLARQVAEQRIRLGIVLLRDCALPELLRTKNYIDARSDQEAGVRETVEWLKRRESVQRLSGLQAPVYLPEYRPKDFVGREGYLARLQAMLMEPGVVLLHGGPGTGKSVLALRFAWEAQKDFDAVVYQSCGVREIDAITTELADRLPIGAKDQPIAEKRKQCMRWLRERQSLLVLDDVWGPEIRQLEPGPPCSVLYTSRKAFLPWISAEQSLEVESFREEEAERLFHSYLDEVFGESEVTRNRQALLGFAQQVGMLPIAVAVGASLLRGRPASRLERSVLKLHLEDLSDGVRDVSQLFQKAIEAQPEREKKLLAASAVCVQEGFWLPLAARITGFDEDEADDAADALVNSSLMRVLNREQRRFQLHALLREEVRTGCGAEELEKLELSHVEALHATSGQWQEHSPVQFLSEVQLASKFLEATGDLEKELSLYRKEEEMLLALKNKGGLTVTYWIQASLLHRLQRLEEALALLEKQEAICLEIGEKVNLQGGYAQRAMVLQGLQRPEEALVFLKKQEAICIELGAKDSLQVSYHTQAYILWQWGRHEEGLVAVKKAEAICLELGYKTGLAQCYSLWGWLAHEQGDIETARQKFQQAIVLFTELKMPKERDIIQTSLNDIATG